MIVVVLCVILVVISAAAGTTMSSDGLRSTLIQANPCLHSLKQRTNIEKEQTINPFEPPIRALKFWKRVAPIVIHYKFTEYWFKVAHVDNQKKRAEVWDKLHYKHAPAGLDCILELRGLFVKIGQVLSSRADFIPRQYVDVFAQLQDSVPPWEKERVLSIVRDSLMGQGLDIDYVFESFDGVLGSASIGQVHKARLTQRFGGSVVACKVMHPNAESRFRNDFKIFKTLCKVVLPGWDPILREIELQMMTEFDYTNEGRNLQKVRSNMLKSPYKNKVKVPYPILDLCSKNLLVMEYLEGKKLAVAIEEKLASILGGDVKMARKVLEAKQQALFESKHSSHHTNKGFLSELNDILVESNVNMSAIQKGKKAVQLMSMTRDARNKLNLLLDATGYQIFNDGLYNGDSHPGNILVLDCGKLGLIDYGQTRDLTKHDRLALAAVICALGRTHVDKHEVSKAMNELGFKTRCNNEENLANFAALYFDSDIAGKKLGYATPQKYLQHLNTIDPMVDVPDPAVFVARTSFLFRGLGALLQQQLHTSQHWKHHAKMALDRNGECLELYNLGLTPIANE